MAFSFRTPNTQSSTFTAATKSGAFGQQQQQQQSGTGHVKYNPVVGTDVVVAKGTSQSVNIKHHCITFMKEYENKSFEELRLEDYVAGQKGNASGVFGGFQQQTENKPLFGNTSAPFVALGATPASTAHFLFSETGIDTNAAKPTKAPIFSWAAPTYGTNTFGGTNAFGITFGASGSFSQSFATKPNTEFTDSGNTLGSAPQFEQVVARREVLEAALSPVEEAAWMRVNELTSQLAVPRAPLDDDLGNHPSVEVFRNVSGVEKNIYFFTHDYREQTQHDNNSRANHKEAHMTLALANYLMQQGYTADDITILAAYSGQMSYMRECDKWLVNRVEYKSHVTSEHPLSDEAKKFSADDHTPFVCEVCGQMFKQQCFLTYHQRKHTGERPYKCHDCDKTFQLAGALSIHRSIHSRKRPHKCEMCARVFTFKSALNKHMKVHLGIRPHKCAICDKGFIHMCDLKLHIKYVHDKIPWPKKKNKRPIDDAPYLDYH